MGRSSLEEMRIWSACPPRRCIYGVLTLIKVGMPRHRGTTMNRAKKKAVNGGGPSQSAGGLPREQPAEPPPEEPALVAHGGDLPTFCAPADNPSLFDPELPVATSPTALPVPAGLPEELSPSEPLPPPPPPPAAANTASANTTAAATNAATAEPPRQAI